jgi:SAM-dependent methyltransferase
MTPKNLAHYRGQQGQAYFEYQSQGGPQRGKINARKFASYVHPSDRVLDFGCGDGSLLSYLNCKRRIGMEINLAARVEAEKAGVEIHETLGSIPDQSVDIIISNHALEHVLCPMETLRELHDKLVLGGKLVLCLPIDDWRTQKSVNNKDVNHHLYTWTPLLLGNLLIEAGFDVERVWVYTHAWPPVNWQKLDEHLPVWLFDLVCWFISVRDKRRQIMAVAGI